MPFLSLSRNSIGKFGKCVHQKKFVGGLPAGWQAVCHPLSEKLACRMTVDLSIIDTGTSDKPNC